MFTPVFFILLFLIIVCSIRTILVKKTEAEANKREIEESYNEEKSEEKNNSVYFIDTSGRIVSKGYDCKYESPELFDEYGVATVYVYNESGTDIYYIDKDFNVLGDKTFNADRVINFFYDGKEIFVSGAEQSIDVYDENMNIIFSIPYDMPDVEGMYHVVGAPGTNGLMPIKDSKSGKWGYINMDGKVVIDYSFQSAECFSDDNVAIVRAENGLEGAIDENGDYVIEPIYYRLSPFVQGRAFAELKKNGGSKLIDVEGKTIANGTFELPSYGARQSIFIDGLACIQDYTTKKYGYINTDGDYVIEPRYERAYDFMDGLARVEVYDTKKYGYIDVNGNYVVEPKYDELGKFVGGYAYAMNDKGLCGAVDTQGNEVIPCQYEHVTSAYEGIFGVKKAGLYGYYSIDKGWIVEPQYEQASRFENGYAIVE